jgi:hypothetical protein
VLSGLTTIFDGNLRTSFFILTFPVFLGSWILFRARKHLEADTQRIFEAILTAMAEQQAREEAAAVKAAAEAGDDGDGGPVTGGGDPDPPAPSANGHAAGPASESPAEPSANGHAAAREPEGDRRS